jgi:hypothetical protein
MVNKMIRRQIRNLKSKKPIPPRLFDVIIDDEHTPKRVFIEQKVDKNHKELVPWEDVKYQVESAIQESKSVI